MTETAAWPYDADRDDPLTAHRIPVTSYYPDWRYIACFDRESEQRPTDAAQAVAEARECVLARLGMAVGSYDRARDEHLVNALIAAVRHHDAETVRDLSRQGYSAQEAAKKIDAADRRRPERSDEVELRYADGPTIRIAGYSVTTDAETGLVVVEGFITSRTGQPHCGDAVRLDYLGIPGRGAIADVTASVELFSRLTVLNIRIRATIRPEETP